MDKSVLLSSMFVTLVFPILICIYNMYKRFCCIVKVKFTKFTLITLVIVLLAFLYLASLAATTAYYLSAITWWLAFFTSVTSAGITERGFNQPWNIISRIYKWEKLKEVYAEEKNGNIMITFKAFREYRQEYDMKDFSKIKKIYKEKTNKNLEKR